MNHESCDVRPAVTATAAKHRSVTLVITAA